MRIAVVSHALVEDAARARWRRLAERYPVDVTLIVPDHWRSTWFGTGQEWRPSPVREGRFRVCPVPVVRPGDWGRYVFRSIDAGLREARPDVVYVIQEEVTLVLQQMLAYRAIWARSAKLAFFSWNNLRVPQGSWRARLAWSRVRSRADLAVAGNTEVRTVLGSAGFEKPICVQTEIGIDERVFHPDRERRESARQRLALSGLVIGFSGRLVPEKGVVDVANALTGLQGDWKALFVGEGSLRGELERIATEGGWRDRLVLTGHVEFAEVPDLIRAMDCLVLPSRTVAGWKEQFGLVLAQAMACGTPVIGSSSGAIPEVMGDAGLLFQEGDVVDLRRCLERVLRREDLRMELADKGRRRALTTFSADALAEETHRIFSRLLHGAEPA